MRAPWARVSPIVAQRADALARARLAHDPERAPAGKLEGDAVHGVHHPAFGGELHVQVLHLAAAAQTALDASIT